MKGIVSGILFVLLSVSLFTGAYTVQSAKTHVSSRREITRATDTDWWSMFHHDQNRTGTSTSTGPTTNNTLWTYTTGGQVSYSSPAVVDGLVYVGSASGDHRVYCLDASTGLLVWSYPIDDEVESSPDVANGVVYVGSNNGNVYALNATTGNLVWEHGTSRGVFSSPAVVGGMVYVGDNNYNVYCLDAATGALVWSCKTGQAVCSSPAVVGGMVYVGSSDKAIHCIDASTGSLVWSYLTGGYVWSSPAVAGGLVYVGSCDCNVYCLSAATGSLVWRYMTGNGVLSSPAVVNGVVYVGCADDKIYAFGSSSIPQTYSVSFSESGLAQGSQWSVTFNGQTADSTSNSINFDAPNGVYAFFVTPPSGYDASPSSGSITVNGAIVEEQITFTPSSSPQNLKAQPASSSVGLRWNPPMDVGHSQVQMYSIYRGTSTGTETFLNSVDGTTLEYVDNTISSDYLYYYYVTASTSTRESPASNEVKCSSLESIKGIENVVELNGVKTTSNDPFSIQQNFWIYGPSHMWWAQNAIFVWPLSSKMSGTFEIYDYSPGSPPPPLNKVVFFEFTISIPSIPLKSPLTLRSSIENNHVVMQNDCTQYVWDRVLTSDYYLDMFSPEMVIVGNPVKSAVSFAYPSNGHADTYVRIGGDIGSWLHGSNTVIRPPIHASTAETSTGLQWNTNGFFGYSAGLADQGLQFAPNYAEDIVFPPSVSPPLPLASLVNAVAMYLYCPANLSLVDLEGNHLGYNKATGLIDQEISEALYSFSGEPQVIMIFNPIGNYSLQVVGTENGNFTLEVQLINQTGATVTTLWNSTGTTTQEAVSSYEISTSGVMQVSQVVPEFRPFFFLPLFMMATLLAAFVFKRKHKEKAE